MSDEQVQRSVAVNTVLGSVPAQQLGIVAVHEALLSTLPGAQYAPDLQLDRAEVFDRLRAQLLDFQAHGGGTVVDSTGMFHGRDVKLLEALSHATGVHIIASTGMGPEELLGGYFLTPQTNPPTPWPAEKFAELFAKEINEGMVVPRVERRGAAGLITTTATREGMTATDESLFRGAARAALQTGVSLSIRFGADPLHDLEIVLDEDLPADRVLIGGVDRADATETVTQVAQQGVYIGIDSIGQNDSGLLDDTARVELVLQLITAGHTDRILLSSNAVGVAQGVPESTASFSTVLADFVPQLRSAGVNEADLDRLLIINPQTFLAVRSTAH